MMNTRFYIALLILSAILCFQVSIFIAPLNAAAETSLDLVDKDYPGWSSTGESYFNVGIAHVQLGLTYYYRLYGSWPESWQSVRDTGLLAVDIPGYTGDVIDPDDPNLDFYGDIYYDTQATAEQARLIMMDYNGGYYTDTIEVDHPTATYADFFEMMDNNYFEGESIMGTLLNDSDRMRQFAVLGVIDQSMWLYYLIHQDYPHCWDEFVESGLSPVGAGTSPVTGNRFYGDGRADDFLYEYEPTASSDDKPGYRITPTDSNGCPFPVRFTL